MSWLLLVGAYLLGAVPFGLLIGYSIAGIDVRTLGSGNVGATNVLRCVGRTAGLAVLVLDMAKGAIPVLIAAHLEVSTLSIAGVALASVVGHVFSIFLGFRGGKGVATAIGAFLPLAPVPSLILILIFLLIFFWRRIVSLASVVSAGLFPILLLISNRVDTLPPIAAPIVLSAAIVSALIIGRHVGNIQRILDGDESRLEDPVEVRTK